MEENQLINTKIEGKNVSPILPEHIKNYLIDIDGTICDDIPNEEPERMETAELYPDALVTLNQWFDEGHIMTFFTSRLEEHREVTEKWLVKNGFKFHGIGIHRFFGHFRFVVVNLLFNGCNFYIQTINLLF